MRNLGDARERPTTALLLAAGMGSRLAPLTDSTAKCLVGLSGIPILERLIRTLSGYGFTRLVVVVGHESDSIQDYLGDHSGDIEISYLFSRCYRTTNNIYSLWLARKVIDEPFLLIESDLVFDESLLEGMLKADRIAVSRQLPWMNGTTVTLDRKSGISAFCLGEMSRPDATHYKTVNIYSFSRATWMAICERLDRYIVAHAHGRLLRVRLRRDGRRRQPESRRQSSSTPTAGTRSTRLPTWPPPRLSFRDTRRR